MTRVLVFALHFGLQPSLPWSLLRSIVRNFTMGRGKKRQRELSVPSPASWDTESEEQWWADGYEGDDWFGNEGSELHQRVQQLEDLLHAERCQRKKAQALLAKYENMHHRLLNIVVKEFRLPCPPEPMPHLTRLEHKREIEKYHWVVVQDAGPSSAATAAAATRTRAMVQAASQ